MFHKVYLDRAFNYRDVIEFTYCYCIEHQLSWEKACELSKKAESLVKENNSGQTVHTQFIASQAETFLEEENFLDYIAANSHNFKNDINSAIQKRDSLLEEVRGNKKGTGLVDLERKQSGEFQKGYFDNMDPCSIKTMLEVIIETPLSVPHTRNIFQNANLPQEIKNCFPTEQTFAKDKPSFEELRKMIILLASYKFWIEMQQKSGKPDYRVDIEDYTSYLNNLLLEVNLPPLYYGNPYDWLFLYCAITFEDDVPPLFKFRSIMSEVLSESYGPDPDF